MEHVQAHKRLLRKRQFGLGSLEDLLGGSNDASARADDDRGSGGGGLFGGLFGGDDDDDDDTTSVITRPTTTTQKVDTPTPNTPDPTTTSRTIVEPTTKPTTSSTTIVTRPTTTSSSTRTTATPTTTSTTSSSTTTSSTTTSTPTSTSPSTTSTSTSTSSSDTTTSTSTSSSSSSSSSQESTSTYTHTPTRHSVTLPSTSSGSESSSGVNPNATLAVPNNSQSGGISSGSIAGIVIGVLLGLAVIGAIATLLLRRHKKKQDEINHFNASNFRRSAFLIDESGHDDYNPYGAAVAASQASHSGMAGMGAAGHGGPGSVMSERQYNNFASNPGYPGAPYAASMYSGVAHPVSAFAPETPAYPFADPSQHYPSPYYANGVDAGTGVGGYYPGSHAGAQKPLPAMPLSPVSNAGPYHDAPHEAYTDSPFGDAHHVSAPDAGASAVELARATSVGSLATSDAHTIPLNIANPDQGAAPTRKLSAKRVPVPDANEDLMAFPSPPSAGGAATIPLPVSPPPSVAPPSRMSSMAIPASLTPGGSQGRVPSPKRDTLYDPEDVYGGM